MTPREEGGGDNSKHSLPRLSLKLLNLLTNFQRSKISPIVRDLLLNLTLIAEVIMMTKMEPKILR